MPNFDPEPTPPSLGRPRRERDPNEVKAELQGVKSVLDKLEIEHEKGLIDFGRYSRLKIEHETRKAELEGELDNLAQGQQTSAAVPAERSQSDKFNEFVVWLKTRKLSYWKIITGIIALAISCQVVVAVVELLFHVDSPAPTAIVATPTPSLAAAVKVTAFPTASLVATNTPTLQPTNQPPSSNESEPSQLSVPILTPILTWLEGFLNDLPKETWPVLLSTIGITLIIFGSWLLHKAKTYDSGSDLGCVLNFVVFIAICFIGCWLWGWLGIVLGPIIGLFAVAAVSIHGLGGVVLWAIGGSIVCSGASFLYLAIPGPFVSAYIVVGALIGGVLGTIIGFAVKKNDLI